jgi:fatty-acyl-CoA synthase
VTGRIPLGYYKDPEASARAFPEIQGVRHSVPGDFATVEADGTMRLLGRGSQCINTGGEKVFVEEVEDVLRTHAAVADAAVVGVPDPTWGQAVCALVQPERGRRIDVGDVITHVKAHLAGYKAPRRVLVVDSLARGPHGKVDYKALAALAASDSHREEIP